eukprot:7464732-Pyramimonas_sp.AAC.1
MNIPTRRESGRESACLDRTSARLRQGKVTSRASQPGCGVCRSQTSVAQASAKQSPLASRAFLAAQGDNPRPPPKPGHAAQSDQHR